MPETHVRGIEETRARLQNLNSTIIKNVKTAIHKRSLPRAVRKAKQFCTPGESPYEDMVFMTKIAEAERRGVPYTGAPIAYGGGDLRRSITSKMVSDSHSVTGVVGTNSDYAEYVHNGTTKMFARPFLQDAVIECMPDTINDVNDAIQSAIQEAGLQAADGNIWRSTPSYVPTMPEESK